MFNLASAATSHSSPRWDPIVAFEEYLTRIGRAPATRLKYVQALHALQPDLGAVLLWELSASDINLALERWERRTKQEKGRAPSRATVRGRVCALRSFFAWAERFDLLISDDGSVRPNPMRQIVSPTVPQRPNDRLLPREDFALLAAPRTPDERMIVWLLRWTGLRVSEATQLVIGDIDLTPGTEGIRVRSSKSAAGVRTVPVIPELRPELEIWLEHLRCSGRSGSRTPLLATKHGTAMKTTYVWRVVKRVAAEAGVRVVPCTCGSATAYRHAVGCPRTRAGENRSEISPHTLRRTFATDLLNRGVRLEVVSKLLGHASVAVTQKAYATLLDSTARVELLRALGHDVK